MAASPRFGRAAEESMAGRDNPQNKPETMCQWFLMCRNAATSVEPHPILGSVPICDGCAAKIAALA